MYVFCFVPTNIIFHQLLKFSQNYIYDELFSLVERHISVENYGLWYVISENFHALSCTFWKIFGDWIPLMI